MESDNRLVALGRKDAEELLKSFIPLFKWLNEHQVDYCLVGGLGVLLHAYKLHLDRFRATVDADIMFDASFTNTDFAKAYLEIYASDPLYGQVIYDAVFGEGAFEDLAKECQALVNIAFIGARFDLDGVSTPDIDVVRKLNGVVLETIEREQIEICGVPVTVATAHQLLVMKERTIDYLKVTPANTPRPQDYIDVHRLRDILTMLAEQNNGRSR